MERIARIVDQLYDAALDSTAWPAALSSICELMQSDHAVGLVRDEFSSSLPFVGTARIDPVHIPPFTDAAGAGMAMLDRFPERRAFSFDSVIPRAEFLNSDLFNDVFRPMGGYSALMTVPLRQPGTNSFLAVCRTGHDPEFDHAAAATLEQIAPHVARALRIKLRLDGGDACVSAALGAFDQIDTGLAITDRELRLIAINQRLEQILFRHDGLALSRRTLTAGDRASGRILTDMVWRAASEDSRVASARTMLLRRPQGRPPWSVTVRRLDTRRTQGAAGLVILLVEDLVREIGEIEPALSAVFNLTPREATLAAALARGKDLADAAAALGITLGTARIYLKSIFAKTHTRRQAELVALILRLTRFSG